MVGAYIGKTKPTLFLNILKRPSYCLIHNEIQLVAMANAKVFLEVYN